MICRLTVGLFFVFLLGACGNSGQNNSKIVWHEGTPPPNFLASVLDSDATSQPGPSSATSANSFATTPVATQGVPATGDRLITSTPGVNVPTLTAAERREFQPNELGLIPILMYHEVIESGSTADGYTRTVSEFKADLQRLYDLGYYVISLRDILSDEIDVPAGKHPVALTFDDGTADHFRYLIQADGSVVIDSISVVGILESFFADHPDFGRGGYFAVPPTTCFDWEKTGAEPDQTPYCATKLQWLLDNGYEVGNHTVDHGDLLDLDDKAFMAEVGGGWAGLVQLVPELKPEILAMPYGNYPDNAKHPEERQMMRDGFVYEGMAVSVTGALMVGANPAYSPANTEWDPLYIARIRAYDGELGSEEWLDVLAADPDQLYTSDGDPQTITVPAVLSPALEGSLDTTRLSAEGKTIVIYDPNSGQAI